MITALSHPNYTKFSPSTSYSVRRLNEGLCLTARLTEHVVAPVRRGDSCLMVYQATDPFYCDGKGRARSLGMAGTTRSVCWINFLSKELIHRSLASSLDTQTSNTVWSLLPSWKQQP